MAVLSLVSLLISTQAIAQGLILNEYNAVRSGAWTTASSTVVNSGLYIALPFREDDFFATLPGLPDGRIQKNGGNWWEFVVLEDHLDIRGWELRWANTSVSANRADGITDLWYGDPTIEQGIVTIGNNSVWAHLRSGTIITLIVTTSIDVDVDIDGSGNRNFTRSPLPTTADVSLDLSTDISFSPAAGDWHINVSSEDELDSASPLVTTAHNRTDQGPGFFAAGQRDFQLTILDESDNVVFGPIGEAIAGYASLTDMTGKGFLDGHQVSKLEVDPSSAAANAYFQDGGLSTFGLPNRWSGGNIQDVRALRTAASVPSVGPSGLVGIVAIITAIGFWHATRSNTP